MSRSNRFISSLCIIQCALCIVFLAACDSSHDSDNPIESSSANANRNVSTNQPELARLEFPKVKGGQSVVILHKTSDSYNRGLNFATEWDCEKKSQRWSCYVMLKSQKVNGRLTGGYKMDGIVRRDDRYDRSRELLYMWDKDMPKEYYLDDDYYWGSNFQHGHICPSADRLYSNLANDQTFYLTNLQPQYGAHNTGIWQEMEAWVRNQTPAYDSGDTLFVCKGTTIDKESDIIKHINGKLIVPKYFYMALLLKNNLPPNGYRAIAFWTENETNKRTIGNQNEYLKEYCISIDELEERTGIDFFCNLPDDVEKKVESSYSLRAWGIPE